MPAESNSLDDLRRDIDEIDMAIHDLLMQRAEIGRQIGAAKGNSGTYIRPGREAQILRRLIERHRGPCPGAVVVHIWREIIGALTALQGPFTVAVSSAEGAELRRVARDHYGSQAPLTSYDSNTGVLRAVTDRQATIGILPLPRSDEPDPWWRHLARGGESAPRIIARLPFAGDQSRAERPEALAVALTTPEESGKDRSYMILETAQEWSRGTLRLLLKDAGLWVVDVQGWHSEQSRRLHLLEIEGFLAADDPRLAQLPEDDGEEGLGSIWLVGGYAVPLSAGELAAAESREAGT